MRRLLSSVVAVVLATLLAPSPKGPVGPSGLARRALLATDNPGTQTGLRSESGRDLKPGQVGRHDSPPLGLPGDRAEPWRDRFTDDPPAHLPEAGQLRPASLGFALYPTGPPITR